MVLERLLCNLRLCYRDDTNKIWVCGVFRPERVKMRLQINGILREFIPIKQFRQQHGLPDDFGVAWFEPKDFSGLAAIDQAGTALNHLRQQVLAAVPNSIKLAQLPVTLDHLQQQFRTELNAINDQVGLKDVEIEYAVAGFADVNQALLYELLRHQRASAARPDFATVYHTWLNHSVRVASTSHTIVHNQSHWSIQIVNHAYGRVGLMAHVDGKTTHYVHDSIYACPAEGFMFTLLAELANKIMANLAP